MALAPSLCIAKLKTTGGLVCSKDFSFRPGLLDDLLQQIDVAGEGFLAGRRQGAGRERAIVGKRFRYGHITRFLERAHVGGQVAIGHPERISHLGERELGRGGQHGHDGQPPFLVNHTVELEEWFRVHAAFFRFSVKYRYMPAARCKPPNRAAIIKLGGAIWLLALQTNTAQPATQNAQPSI